MADHVIDIHQALLTTQGEGSDVEISVEDLGAAMNAAEKDDSAINNNENVKKPKEEAEEKVECRLCHQGDLPNLMEAPCSCNGTLKYAHRVCVQRWCDAKGNITCEICHQPYQPNYTAAAPRPPPNGTTINPSASGGWTLSVANPLHLGLGPLGRFADSLDEDTTLGNLLFGTGLILCLGFYLLIVALEIAAVICVKFRSP